jgi:PAS domain S-box-containing protein
VTIKDYSALSKEELLARLQELEFRRDAAQTPRESPQETARRQESGLRDSEERLRAILDTAVEGIITIDEHGLVESVNPAAAAMFGYAWDEIIGQNVKMLMPPPFRQEHDHYLTSYRETGLAKIIGIGREVAGRRKDGSIFPLELSVAEARLSEGRKFVGFLRDITARKESERRILAALKEVTDIKAALDEHSIVAITDPAGRITYVNDKFCAISKYSRGELIGQDHRIINSRHHSPAFFRELWTTIARGKVWHGEIRNRARDGSFYWVDTTIFPFLNDAGKPVQYVAIRTDITALRDSEAQILAIAEREQMRIGAELHDGLGQQLTAIELMCQSLKEDLPSGHPGLEKQAAQIGKFLREAIAHTRSLARGLSPVNLGAAGLADALAELAHRTADLGRVKCRFRCPDPVLLEDGIAARHLFRIAQEAVNNALKHAQAREIVLGLSADENSVRLTVSDDGRGFPKSARKGQGLGLEMMKHRAGVIGAEMQIESRPGEGVAISCVWRRSAS